MRYRVILPKIGPKGTGSEDAVRRILARLAELETNPRPTTVKKLKGRKGGGFAWAITG